MQRSLLLLSSCITKMTSRRSLLVSLKVRWLFWWEVGPIERATCDTRENYHRHKKRKLTTDTELESKLKLSLTR